MSAREARCMLTVRPAAFEMVAPHALHSRTHGVLAGNDIGLPGLQSPFALAVLRAAAAAHVPVVLVLLHNLPVSFDELLQVRLCCRSAGKHRAL